ncbi:2-amino-4-hydroxy-6-hydroxymethyldihydropteridine diphosphokinase [Thiomonas intermedia]|uniref:2-amino-4-hydroxy-6- hydroxymethyldihydropteridine diphosphokinase n=1 Tax=Thiomonas intermedia TaxID=926 RepID=UPI0009A5337D|nr:2-amino-4-hydroxy-6-hydroxymethyldihydropteridine diphosphokinase [Thiomonas intermedia]
MACADDVEAFIALGANLGDGAATLRAAVQAIDALPLTRVVARSSLYRTAPQHATGPDYWNAVVQVRTAQSPEALLDGLLGIEARMGRQRPIGAVNAPRTLDLDLLLYGSLQRQSERLTLPHPRMAARAFVLAPLAEIWPEGRLAGSSVAELAERRLAEGQRIQRLEPL